MLANPPCCGRESFDAGRDPNYGRAHKTGVEDAAEWQVAGAIVCIFRA